MRATGLNEGAHLSEDAHSVIMKLRVRPIRQTGPLPSSNQGLSKGLPQPLCPCSESLAPARRDAIDEPNLLLL